MAYTEEELKKELESKEYAYGFYTDIESDTFPVGLNEEVVRAISKRKNEPAWMTEWRLEAYEAWSAMEEPDWANVDYPKPDFQAISYYSAPKKAPKYNSLDEVDPELLDTFKKLGIPVEEQKRLSGVAVDIVMDSVSVATTFKETLPKKESFFVLFRKRLKNIQTWYANTSEQWCHAKTIITQPSTRQYFLMDRFAISPKGFVAQWNSQPIFVSIRQAQVSLNAHSSSLMRGVM